MPGRCFSGHLENDVVFEYDDKLHSAKHFLGGSFKERLKAAGCTMRCAAAASAGRSEDVVLRALSPRPALEIQEEDGASRETALNPAEVDAIQQWIRQNNPTLDQIDSRAAAR